MSWCWLVGHRWERIGTNIMGYPIVMCTRCLRKRAVR